MNPKYRLAFVLGIAQLVALAAAARQATDHGGHRHGPGGRRPDCADRGPGPRRHHGGHGGPPGPSRFRERLETWHREQHAEHVPDRPDADGDPPGPGAGDDQATT